MKKGPVVPSIGRPGWSWKAEPWGVYAVCGNVRLLCDSPSAGTVWVDGFEDESTVSFGIHEAYDLAQRLLAADLVWSDICFGFVKVPARTKRPRMATGVPPISWHEAMRRMADGFVKHAQDQLDRQSALYRLVVKDG